MKKNYLFLVFILFLTSFLFISPQTSFADNEENKDQIEKIIWDLENDYLTYFKDAVHEKVILLWHDQFLGWPDSESEPSDKSAVIKYLKKYSKAPASWSFKIEKAGIRIYGKIVITHFIQHVFFKNTDGTEFKRSTRITHTWIKEDSTWRILGGMSARIRKY